MLKVLATIIFFNSVLFLSALDGGANDVFIGYWDGTLSIMGQSVDMQLDLREENGVINGYLSIPVQMMRDFPLTKVQIDYHDIEFSLTSGNVTALFSGRVEFNLLTGSFVQPGAEGEFSLKRSAREPEPDILEIQGEQELSIETYYGRIYGSLVIPETEEKMPVALIIAGSGPTDRDGNNPLMGKGYIYRDLALELKKAGVASLRFDKRGIGASEAALARESDIRFNYYVEDAISWLEKLKEMDLFSSFYIMGHSEGSLIGIFAAQREDISGFVSIAGMGRSMGEILREQLSDQPEPYRSEAYEIIESLEDRKMVQNMSDELKPLFRVEIQPYLLSVMKLDPAVEISRLEIPVLIVQGTTDLQVKEIDARLLFEAAEDSELVLITGMNHVMRDAGPELHDNFRTYGQSGLPFSEGFIDYLVEFIK